MAIQDVVWYYTEESKPEIGLEVLGWNQEWVDEDFNPDGTRVCFIDDENHWFVASWCGTHDEWHTKYSGDTEQEADAKGYYVVKPPSNWTYKPKWNGSNPV